MDLQLAAQPLGNFGEFFGAIAVLATLICLAIQIRQSKDAIKMKASAELAEFIAGWEDNVVGMLRTPGDATWYQATRYLFDREAVLRIDARPADADAGVSAWTELIGRWQIDAAEAPPAA